MSTKTGTTHDDTLNGTNGHDLMFGLAGNDALFGRGGDDKLVGGLGNDTLDGGDDDDRLFGEEDDDRLIGGRGRDTLDGGSGNDVMRGGRGDDLYIVDSELDQVVELTNEGIDTIRSAVNISDLAANVENLVLVPDQHFGLFARGNELDNRVMVQSGGGVAIVDGGAGNDTLIGGDPAPIRRLPALWPAICSPAAPATTSSTAGRAMTT
jgi:Ca2+-binding RTX toxin-like protein